MRPSRADRPLADLFSGAAREAGGGGAGLIDTATLEAESYTEKLPAPPEGALGRLSRGPLVEGNLTLEDGSGNAYIEGYHYLESPAEGAFENMRIRQGTTLTASYFYLPEEEASGSGESDRLSPRYATLLKRGL